MEKIKSIFVLTCLLLAVPCAGEPIIVDVNTTNPSADFHNIKDAISSPTTTDGDIIVVNPGVYTGVNNRNLDFLGKAITVQSSNPNDPDIVAATIIDCQELGCGFLFLNGEDGNSIVDGFTITNGQRAAGGGMYLYNSSPTVRNCVFSGNSSGSSGGGGMYNYYNSCPTVSNCTFVDNSSTGDGGAMYNNDSSPTIINCTFVNNSVNGKGGGMYNYNYPFDPFSSCPQVSNCTFIGNSSTGTWGSGGGMSNNNATPTMSDCTFTNNSASYHGGGIHNDNNSTPTVINCVFSANSSNAGGGGMYNGNNSYPTVTNCTFTNNSANTSNGGGMFNYKSSPTITNCTFTGNSSTVTGGGGGMYNYTNSLPTISSCTFTNNSAGWLGGGMFNRYYSSPTIANCTFSGNWAGDYGDGILNWTSSPEIVNCILWGNNPVEIGNMLGSNPIVSYSDVNEGYAGETNISLDPLFVDPDSNDFHLLADSPCIDAGDPCGVYVGQTDIDGEPRVFGSCVDMGSDEAWPDVELTPSELEYDFGDVNLGTSAMTIVTISNSGSANLTVSAISFTPDSNSDFSITAWPNLPAAIEPDGFVDVTITYSPSVEGYAVAILEIISDDPDENLVQISLGGLGVQTELPPSQQIIDILAFIETSVNGQPPTLVGSGPGNSGEGRLGALINMIEAAGDLIEAESFEEGCQQLQDAYRRTDAEPRPPDFVSGQASTELAGMIEDLRTSLECQ